jgi:hypothetical protein
MNVIYKIAGVEEALNEEAWPEPAQDKTSHVQIRVLRRFHVCQLPV